MRLLSALGSRPARFGQTVTQKQLKGGGGDDLIPKQPINVTSAEKGKRLNRSRVKPFRDWFQSVANFPDMRAFVKVC
jgi:hypothetical protein